MQNDYDDTTPFPDPVVIEITDVFDLHTIPPREVKAVVEEYLTEAHALGFPVVGIIYGKGVGVQCEIVSCVMAGRSIAFEWNDAAPYAGGLCETIERLVLHAAW